MGRSEGGRAGKEDREEWGVSYLFRCKAASLMPFSLPSPPSLPSSPPLPPSPPLPSLPPSLLTDNRNIRSQLSLLLRHLGLASLQGEEGREGGREGGKEDEDGEEEEEVFIDIIMGEEGGRE